MARAVKPKSDLDVLAPAGVEVVIGGQTYSQRPLTLRKTALLVNIVAGVFEEVSTTPAMARILNTDLEGGVAPLVGPIVQMLARVPDALPHIITVILTGKEEAETVDHIAEYATLPDAMRILTTFVAQNEPEELIANFTLLRSTVVEAIAKAKTSQEPESVQ